MGNRLLPHRHRKAQRRRALRLAQGRPGAHDQWTSRQPPRRTPALELAAAKRQNLTTCKEWTLTEIRRMISSRCTAPPQWRGRSFERIRQKGFGAPHVEAAQIVANESARRRSSEFIGASGPVLMRPMACKTNTGAA